MKEFNFPLQTMNAQWKDLLPHYRRGILFFVRPHVQLLELGTAVAEDNKDYIMAYINDKSIFQIDPKELPSWEENHVFSFIIVQPYVFVEYVNEDH